MDTFLYDHEFKRKLRNDPHPFGEVSFLESLAEPGMIAIDVGANKGLSTVAIATKVGPQGLVYAFEPVPEYYRILQDNLSRNGIQNVHAYRLALGERKERTDYYKDGEGSGIVRQDGAEKISVNVTTLDSFAGQEGLDHIDLLSMDCEGSEVLVLKGAEKTLQSGSIKIFLEVHRSRLRTLGQSVEQVVKWLERRSFQVRPVLVDTPNKAVDYESCTHLLASRGVDNSGPEDEVERLEKELSDLEARWPAHSVPPSMLQEREELEEKLEKARRRAHRCGKPGGETS